MTAAMIPETMTAMVTMGHGDFDKLVWHEDWPVPKAASDEVLVKVGACGLNNTDINTRTGWYSKTVSEATTGGAYDEVGSDDRPGAVPLSPFRESRGRMSAARSWLSAMASTRRASASG